MNTRTLYIFLTALASLAILFVWMSGVQGAETNDALPSARVIEENTDGTLGKVDNASGDVLTPTIFLPTVLRDYVNCTIEIVSVALDGSEGNGDSRVPTISANGRYVAFNSIASNLVSGDTNGAWDVFIHDRQTGQTTRISIASDASEGNSDSGDFGTRHSISTDGRYVSFASSASNLVDEDTNESQDIFIHDRLTGETIRVSVASDGSQGNAHSYWNSISGDGRYVAFDSYASNFVSGDITDTIDVFVHDTLNSQTNRVPFFRMAWPSISADGRFVSFTSFGWSDIYVHDLLTGETTLISLAPDGSPANEESKNASISADGRYVAFASWADNLVFGDTNGFKDGFVHDRTTGKTTRFTIASHGSQGNSDSIGFLTFPSISGDGRYIVFDSGASNLVSGDTNGVWDVFIHDQLTGQTNRVSVASGGTQGNGHSGFPFISADGRYVVFESIAYNLVSGDTNNASDVFVYSCGQ